MFPTMDPLGLVLKLVQRGPPAPILKSTSPEGKLVVHLTPSMAARSTSREGHSVEASMLGMARSASSGGDFSLNGNTINDID